ncbi:endolytic transglycosylase MltG [Parageobacillus thermoglucosidasius]|uniref:endolytic transglycosylase MltG n=1 Tax=Parageobacillus thermoglucosidasius TaxID=1426 RepID=UPI001FCACD4B|nr:endolytic transglycosylase MltG [Parageobacillus thermoglucosidasius]BDG31262.1 endolytic murein transglycosylase [Parageobacillus thermoglucosidasius]
MDNHQFFQKDVRIVRKIVLIVSIVVFFTCIVIAAGSYFYIKSALRPVDPDDRTPVHVSIPLGSSMNDIADMLEEKRLIKSSFVFRYYVKLKNHVNFQAGEYQLNRSMPLEKIIAVLKTGKVTEKSGLKLTIPEGTQLTQIAEMIAKKTGYKKEEVLQQLNDRKYIEQLIQKYPSVLSRDILNKNIRYPLEGYLFPATYSFHEKKPPIPEIVETMLKKTEKVLAKYERDRNEMNMTVHQLLTMSSLIEEEATEKAEREKIASVFYNRLRTGMPLQTDPTVLYALGKHKERVYYKDLKVQSPYNTYIHKGLPPGPIANAGEMSIQAALKPAKTDYLYFLATPAGEVIFTKTLEEHNRQKEKHIGKQ